MLMMSELQYMGELETKERQVCKQVQGAHLHSPGSWVPDVMRG